MVNNLAVRCLDYASDAHQLEIALMQLQIEVLICTDRMGMFNKALAMLLRQRRCLEDEEMKVLLKNWR